MYSFITLIYCGKLWYYGINYGTMLKTMLQYRTLWNFDLLWKKNYGSVEKKKTMVLVKVPEAMLSRLSIRNKTIEVHLMDRDRYMW